MKRLLILLLMLFVLPRAARAAEARFYNAGSQTEICYHATPLCIDADGADDKITEAEARTKGLLPCPICVPEAPDRQGVRAVARGGTYVLKMTDAWMNARADIGTVFGFSGPSVYTGDEMLAPLAQRLHGDAYAAFLKAIQSGGSASAPAYYPAVYSRSGELELCRRHIGGAWYTVLRPDEAARKRMAKDGRLKICLRFFGGQAVYENGQLTLGEDDEWEDDDYTLIFEKLGSDAAFTRDDDDFSLSLFEEMGAHIFVLRERDADADLLENVGLTLDGKATGLSLTGYMDGTDAVFVGVFTAPEAARVQSGAALALAREPWLTEEAYQGTDYAIVKKGTAGTGVVDRAGNFVIPPSGGEYGQDIARQGDTFFVHCRQPQSLRVVRIENGFAAELARLDAPQGKFGYVTLEGSNRAVFAAELGDSDGARWQIRDVDNGALLAELPVDESDPDSPTYSVFMGMNLRYALEAAKPERLVFGGLRGEGEAQRAMFWLADHRGRRVSEDWPFIEPLTWSDAGGLFLVSTWEESEHTAWPNDEEDLFAGYDGRAWFGAHWRCGVIDQDGSVLAPCDYTKATLLSATSVQLQTPDGQRVTVDLKDARQ